MSGRGEKRSADVSNRRAGSECRALRKADEADCHRGAPPTIEISDEDYRTLHLPCDTLEESGRLNSER